MKRFNLIILTLLNICLTFILMSCQQANAYATPSSSTESKDEQVNLSFPANTVAATTYYVATTGNDANSGSEASPWQTIQHAADTIMAGDTVLVRGGTYAEAVTINVSGSAANGSITFQSYAGETAVLDGTTLTVPAAEQALFHIDSQNYITFDGFELRNYKTNNFNRLPLGIFVTGDAHHIQLKNNHLHDIENNGGSNGNAHGIAVYGTQAPASINNILIEGNELHDMKLGNSEAMVLNGNVKDFAIINNIVHDVDNIGIDLIGFEDTAPDVNFDQARDGVVKGNTVYNVDTIRNPAYFGERSAAGIYVDGGTQILIERNIVHHSNFGVELASEHAGKATSFIRLQNNLLYLNQIAGLAMGGYDEDRGSTENCVVTNNTFYKNDSLQDGNGELYLQYDLNNNQIENNILVANSQNVFMTNDYTANTGNTVDHNLYYASDGVANGEWQWKTAYYTGFASYQSGSGNDANSVFDNPSFVNEATA